MKFSYNWICANSSDGLDRDAAQRCERLITMKTAECEGIETARRIARRSVSPRASCPSSRSTGSHNVKAGRCRTVRRNRRLRRAQLPRRHRYRLRPLGEKIIDGVESDGMLASARRTRHQSRPLRHHGTDAPWSSIPCTPDSIIEIDNKCITHRPDLWGHYGMAREVAAITGGNAEAIRSSSICFRARPPPVEIEIEDLVALPAVFSALVFENVTVQPRRSGCSTG